MRNKGWLLCVALLAAVAGAGLVPSKVARSQAANLVANGDFESGSLAGWNTCGGVRLADRQAGANELAVHGGRYALRLGSPTDGSCGGTLELQQQAAYDNIRVPADAGGLSLGFWYSRVGTFGRDSAFWDVTAYLTSNDGGPQVRILEYIDADESAGWNHARWELPPDQVAAARGRTFQLGLYFQFSLIADNDLAYYIDDIEVLPVTARTPLTAAPPAALTDTNTRPLLGLANAGGKLQTVRADSDGSDIQPVYANSFGNGEFAARWSSNGAQLATLDHVLQAEPGEQVSANWAQVSVLNIFNADGSGKRELVRTAGKKLVPGSPPGCRPPRTDCTRYDDPALDVLIADYDWSPGGDRLAVNTCSTSRYADGFTSDPICRIQVYPSSGGAPQGEIKPALGVSWSSTDRLLYRVGLDGPIVYGTPQGLWEADPSTAPAGRRQLFAHRLPANEDTDGAWSPDGRYFVTLRYLAHGAHYDSAGTRQLNSSLMLFDREAPGNPRQLVLVDWGRSVDTPAWSPDGKYLVYSVLVAAGYQTYWLEVASGATGLLTGDVIFAEWRPGAATGLTRRVFVPSAAKR